MINNISKRGIKVLLILLALLFRVDLASAQSVPRSPQMPDTSKYKAVRADKPEKKQSTKKKSGKTVQAYKKIVNSNFKTFKGIFAIHKYKDTVYFEIPDSLLHRDILVLSRLASVSANLESYAGEELSQKTIQFEVGADSTLVIRNNIVATDTQQGNAISQAVNRSLGNPILKSLPIVAYGPGGMSYLVDVSQWFKEKNSLVTDLGSSAIDKKAQDGKDFYIDEIATYPLNTKITVSATYKSEIGRYMGWFNVQTNASFIMLPRVAMQRRYADDRIGYFTNTVLPFSDNQQRVDWKKFIVRWRLEPRDADVEKWERGELVEPKKPIVIYIDPAAPARWRPYLVQGINDWQQAFEQAGFKNAIIGKEWPEGDTTMHMDDARYSFLNYFPSETQNAYGPHVNDPRSGEIIQTHIGWYANVMTLLHNWYQIQAGASDPRARHAKFDDNLMGELIRFVSSHEVGHTLGLAHNFGSSSRTPVDSLRNKAFVERYGHTASIMDYARFNYVAQPEDGITEKGLFPRIGDYDKWAIEWGYKPSGAKTADEDEKIVRRWADERLSANPRLWFGDGETPEMKFDPRAQTEDLGDDPVKASRYGIKNLQYILPRLPQWTAEEGNNNRNLTEAYDEVRLQYYRYLNHVLKYVGAYYRNNTKEGQQDAVFVAEPLQLQQDVLRFFDDELFKTPNWILNKAVLDKIQGQLQGQDPVRFINLMQLKTLNSLLDIVKLNKIRTNYNRFGDQCISLQSYISTLHEMVWRELKMPAGVVEDRYRRDLQKTYFGAMSAVLENVYETAENDAVSLIKADLKLLEKELQKAVSRTKEPVTLYHLLDVQKRIKLALAVKTSSQS
ncbi:DUF5117 domain-containing protein [Mucilaginibacter conchicola]|uniref:DUF5117 domain-containing protein n=1 Tax=Mucilaginibacter conchicola TaxID=2303333 RepID=A0A372NPS7_9SPHI|nr:zinc-dependent metalloprotease [Mucilaginibacter conchicola]RFZ90931.1 DUF5117 domain-containing protein [Mucilaginibacter conchicola]